MPLLLTTDLAKSQIVSDSVLAVETGKNRSGVLATDDAHRPVKRSSHEEVHFFYVC